MKNGFIFGVFVGAAVAIGGMLAAKDTEAMKKAHKKYDEMLEEMKDFADACPIEHIKNRCHHKDISDSSKI